MRIFCLCILLFFLALKARSQHFLHPGMELNRGCALYSHDYKYKLVLNPNGRLEIWRIKDNTKLWQSPNAECSNVRCIMQSDGNLVLYCNKKAIWTSGTANNPGAYLLMRIDGNLVIYSREHRAIWASKTIDY